MNTGKTRFTFANRFARFAIRFFFLVFLLAAKEVLSQNFWQQTNGPNAADLRALAINASGHIFAASYGGGIFRSTNNGDSWTVVNSGLTNTDVRVLIIDSTSGHIFAGTDGGGIFRSMDNGASWTAQNSGLPNLNISAFAINSSGNIFAGTNDRGIFRSMDNGENWTAINSGLGSFPRVGALAINSSGHIFAGNSSNVYRSMDNGASWTYVSGSNSNIFFGTIVALVINASGHIFAANDGGRVNRSTNNGNSWTAVNSGLPGTGIGALAINSSGHIFWGGGATYHSTNSGSGVYRLMTNGDNWTAVNSGLTDLDVGALAINSSGRIYVGTYGGVVFRSVQSTVGVVPSVTTNTATKVSLTSATLNGTVNPNDLSTAVKFEYGITGYGSEIMAMPSPVNGASAVLVNAALIGLSSNTLYYYRVVGTNSAGTTRGADQTFTTSASPNQNFWQQTNGPNAADLRALAINSSGHIFTASYGGGIFHSTNNGDSWTVVNNGLTNTDVNALAINSNGHIFAGTGGFGIFRSMDNGASWTAQNSGLSNLNISAFAINSSGNIFAGTNGGGIFRSMDNGESWTAINSGLGSFPRVGALAINSSGHIFAGNSSNVYRSMDNGASWTYVSGSNSNIFFGTIVALAINASGHIFAANDGGRVNRSTNNGNSWTAVNSGLPGTGIGALAINSSGHIFWGGGATYHSTNSGSGIYLSIINGDNWTAVNTGLTDLDVGAIAINSSGRIFAGTYSGVVFRSVQSIEGVAPSVTTNTATNVTSTSATLNGTVNPNGLSTTVTFQYGTTTSYGNQINAAQSPVNGANAVSVSAGITGLSPNTLYHYRVAGTNNVGAMNGANQMFTTSTPNRLPVVADAIPNQMLTVGGPSFTRDLNASSMVFTDPDGDALTYTASSSATNIATASISGSTLTVAPMAVGSATITVTANDERGGTASTTFTVTVGNISNRPPVVANAIPNQTLTVGGASFTRNLNASPAVFNDPDGDALTYTASSSVPAVATANISGSTLTVAPVAAGNATITITANDGRGGTVSANFTVTVTAANRPPVVANAIPNQNLTVGGVSFVRDLNAALAVFSDPDGDALIYTVNSSAASVATASVSISTLTVAPVAAGSATITVTANDGRGGTVSTNFTVTVTAANRPPVVANAIPNQNLTVSGASFVRDLNAALAVFSDPDGDALIYTVNSSAASVATASVSISTLMVAPVATGSATITVTANDGKGGTTSTTFTATVVTAANRPPVVADTIRAQMLTVGGPSFTRNLNASPAVFSDPDGDALSYTASSSLQNNATANISGSTLTVSPVSGGVSTITVTANDGRGGMVSTTFIVTINRPPVLANPIANQTLTVGEASFTRDLNVSPMVFIDPDGDALAYSPSSNAINIATANFSGTVLTVAPVAVGNATITVTANDGRGGIVLTNFTVTVRAANRPPVVANTISNQNLTIGGVSFVRDLNAAQAVFNDPDGDALIYAANSSATNVATASVSISTLRVEPMATGSATITVTANDGRGGIISTIFTVTVNLPAYPSSLNANTTVAYPSRSRASDYPATDYRIVGLPGASNRSVKEFLSGAQNQSWQVYWDNGAANNFFLVFNDGSANFQFSVGRAFWIINKGTLSISTPVPSAPLNAAQEIELPLSNSSWNLITNPFTVSVAWSKIQSANNLNQQPIYAFNGSFSEATSLEPYSGYYFFNATNLAKLKIPYSAYFSSTPEANVDPVIWRVHILFSSGEISDKSTSFGIASEASPDLDRFDFRKPRAIAATPTVEFKRPTWDAKYSIFATDIRPEFEESESWEFDVRAISRQPAQLTFTGISKIPGRFEVYLLDADHAQSVNLREDSLYRFTPAAELMKFKVVVGRKENVQEQLNSLALPKDFTLGPNYPNPFSANGTFGNPTTTIPVAVPAATEIKLKLYNLLGAEVKTLYDGTLEAGRYWFNWDGRNELGNQVATGVYLYRLTTSKGESLLGKMILMR